MPPPSADATAQFEIDRAGAVAFMARGRRYARALRAHRANSEGFCTAHNALVEWPCLHAEMALDAKQLALQSLIPTPRGPQRHA